MYRFIVRRLIRAMNSPQVKGYKGEAIVSILLGKTIEGEQYSINNLVFKNKNGNVSQIDHLLINKYGIWVIETKNYRGIIYGDEKSDRWTQVLSSSDKRSFLNPIKQNASHIKHLISYLEKDDIFYNIVVFLGRADISNVKSDNVLNVDELNVIKEFDGEAKLSKEEMKSYYSSLLELKKYRNVNKEEWEKKE